MEGTVMAYFLFIDESGHDMVEAPYYVLAGLCIKDTDLWNLVRELHEAEVKHFGKRYSSGSDELKGKNLLSRKVYRHLNLNVEIQPSNRVEYARFALEHGVDAKALHLKALAQSKTGFVDEVLDLCASYRCRIFASVVPPSAKTTTSSGLRKDYGYLLERFFYFLEDSSTDAQGIVVFDELDKAQSHILVDQVHTYFRETAVWRQRSARIIPEPFFVHSDLTTGVQIADIAAYCISWGYRNKKINADSRQELKPFADKIHGLCYGTQREKNGEPNFKIHSVAYIPDLRTQSERI